jgi:ribosome-binding protein aMBF1 (putative translation factor)
MNYMALIRRQKGVSQCALAAQLGVSQSLISRCEHGWLTRPHKGLEAKLQSFFGPDWTWERLMQPVPEPTSDAGLSAR